MSDENSNPDAPAGRKRNRKTAAVGETASADARDEAGNETAADASGAAGSDAPNETAATLSETAPIFPLAAENAIGTLDAALRTSEAAGGDPNSPADSALESALKREQLHVDAIATVAAHTGEAPDTTPMDGGDEYPGERDPLAANSESVEMLAEQAAIDAAEEPSTPPETPLDPKELERVVEALLFSAMEPIGVREIARAADSDSATVRKILKALKETGERERRPWDLVELAGAYRFVTRSEFHPAIQRLKTQVSQRKLTQAALETLALIAYRQPIGRAEIESVRGVNAGPVLRLLLDKKLVQISGRGTGVGQPLLYATTDFFLENFGLKNVNELPKPGEFKNA